MLVFLTTFWSSLNPNGDYYHLLSPYPMPRPVIAFSLSFTCVLKVRYRLHFRGGAQRGEVTCPRFSAWQRLNWALICGLSDLESPLFLTS